MDYEVFEYSPSFGEVIWPEGFEEELRGKSIEEQVHCYAWYKHVNFGLCDHKEREQWFIERPWMLSSVEPVKQSRVIVRDGLVVGIVIAWGAFDEHGNWGTQYEYVLPFKGYCYDSTSDNNGAGYKESDWYKYLFCLPASHTFW